VLFIIRGRAVQMVELVIDVYVQLALHLIFSADENLILNAQDGSWLYTYSVIT
jgi:hypothetical protein